MKLSVKQKEFIRNATHRYNFKSGATRSGKSYLDVAYTIISRIRERAGKPGLNVVLGVSKGTIERNVLEPMREIYGTLIGEINSQNICMIAGEPVYCLGAEKISQVAKLRGASIKYCYGDEIAEWNKEVFVLLQSRLDKPYSVMDGALNPSYPNHWLKKFIDNKEIDVYVQNYTIDDNPFLSKEFVDNLKKEYAGTIFYNRYILGQWVAAEGSIYKMFADNPQKFIINSKDADYDFIQVGIDFGGNGSAHTFVATGIKNNYSKLTVLCTERHEAKGLSPDELYNLITRFILRVNSKYGHIAMVYPDCAEQTLINGIKARINEPVHDSLKNKIIDRIRATTSLMSLGRFFITEDCETLKDALIGAVYDDKAKDDTRLDNGTSDIDTLDAFEYSWERYLKQYARIVEG